MDLHIKELLAFGEKEMEKFLDFVKEGLKINKGTMHLTSAKQKFDLTMIKHHNDWLTKILNNSITIISFVIAVMLLIASMKAIRKYRVQKHLKQQPTLKVHFKSLMANEKRETDSQEKNN